MPSSADLGEQLEAAVANLVRTGRYRSRGEILREGVRLVEEKERRLTALDAAVERGLADADAGRVTPAATVGERLAAKYEAISKV